MVFARTRTSTDDGVGDERLIIAGRGASGGGWVAIAKWKIFCDERWGGDEQ